MTLSPQQEDFLRKFFETQREISKESLMNVSLLAKAHIQNILETGIVAPLSFKKAENLLAKLKLNALKRKEHQETVNKLVEEIRNINDGEQT